MIIIETRLMMSPHGGSSGLLSTLIMTMFSMAIGKSPILVIHPDTKYFKFFHLQRFYIQIFLNRTKGITARDVQLNENDMSYQQNTTVREFWLPSNPINTYPKNDLNDAVNLLRSGYYRKTDYIRLQDRSPLIE